MHGNIRAFIFLRYFKIIPFFFNSALKILFTYGKIYMLVILCL